MIAFENIKTGEVVTFDANSDPQTRQAHMAAYLNSSDMSPNASRGQDFGWRLSPEVIAAMDAVRADYDQMDRISRRTGIGVEDVQNYHLLNYVADREFSAEAMKNQEKAKESLHEESYNKRLAEARTKGAGTKETVSGKIEVPTNKEKK